MSIECIVCLECFDSTQIDKVACDSSVDHMICFTCERNWREKMPLKDGVRVLKCPACRQPEQYRTTASMVREFVSQPARSSAWVRAGAISSITSEELDVINARLMGRH